MTVRRRSGLTLLELLVALVVSGLALGAGYQALAWLGDARRRTEAQAQAVARDAAVRRALASWLAGATLSLPPNVGEFRGLDGRRGDDEDDVVAFRTTAATPLGTDETDVRLFVERGAGATRGVVARFASPDGARQMALLLVPNATSLDVRYLTGAQGAARWTAAWVSRSVLPRGAELTVRAARGDSIAPLLSLPMVVAFAGGT